MDKDAVSLEMVGLMLLAETPEVACGNFEITELNGAVVPSGSVLIVVLGSGTPELGLVKDKGAVEGLRSEVCPSVPSVVLSSVRVALALVEDKNTVEVAVLRIRILAAEDSGTTEQIVLVDADGRSTELSTPIVPLPVTVAISPVCSLTEMVQLLSCLLTGNDFG